MEKLKLLGIDSDLIGKFRYSFLAVCRDGTAQYEEMAEKALSYYGTLANGQTFALESAGFSVGNNSSIIVNGKECSVNSRGMNIVVIDPDTNEVIDSVCFDTLQSGFPASRNWIFLQ
jgi:hypothetical protein